MSLNSAFSCSKLWPLKQENIMIFQRKEKKKQRRTCCDFITEPQEGMFSRRVAPPVIQVVWYVVGHVESQGWKAVRWVLLECGYISRLHAGFGDRYTSSSREKIQEQAKKCEQWKPHCTRETSRNAWGNIRERRASNRNLPKCRNLLPRRRMSTSTLTTPRRRDKGLGIDLVYL